MNTYGPPARLYRIQPSRAGNEQVYTYNRFMEKWKRLGFLYTWERTIEVQVEMGIAAMVES